MRKLRLFYDFMIEHGAWEEYKKEHRGHKNRHKGRSLQYASEHPRSAIASAFIFYETNKDREYWWDLSELWIETLKQYETKQ